MHASLERFADGPGRFSVCVPREWAPHADDSGAALQLVGADRGRPLMLQVDVGETPDLSDEGSDEAAAALEAMLDARMGVLSGWLLIDRQQESTGDHVVLRRLAHYIGSDGGAVTLRQLTLAEPGGLACTLSLACGSASYADVLPLLEQIEASLRLEPGQPGAAR